jgi:hypothetical protein
MKILALSLPHANFAYNLSNVILIVGAVLALVGTVGAIWSGSIRERYADTRAQESEEKVANALAEAAKANESNTRLQLKLEKERKERLELQRKVAPRELAPAQRTKLSNLLNGQDWQTAEVIWHGEGESEAYAKEIAAVFEEAGIETKTHTLGPFIPSAWGLMVIQTGNSDADLIKALFDEAEIAIVIAETNDTMGTRPHPLLFVGNKEVDNA